MPRSLAPPATSPRRSLLLRFVPADPVAHVAQESRRRGRSPQWTSRLPAKQRAVRFLLRAPASPSRSSSYISAPLAAAPLRPRRPTRPSNPREAQKLRSLAQQKCSLPEKQRLSHHPSLTTLRPLARRAPSQSRSPQLRFVPADPVAQVARKAREACPPAPFEECCPPRATVRWFAKQLR